MKKHLPLFISAVIAIGLIGGALILTNRDESATARQPAGTKKFSNNALAAFDGREGRECYVAVEGTVYRIDQGRLWQDGKHASSRGKAACGRDLTAAIKQSPHGTSKLKSLDVMGTLESAKQ
jgi:predicted heme/steroid binding protein